MGIRDDSTSQLWAKLRSVDLAELVMRVGLFKIIKIT